jgi:hypothetical protein
VKGRPGEIEARFRKMMLQCSGEERLRMGLVEKEGSPYPMWFGKKQSGMAESRRAKRNVLGGCLAEAAAVRAIGTSKATKGSRRLWGL